MISILMRPLYISAPIIRYGSRDGGHLNAYGGGKIQYKKGSHYRVPVDSKHPYNIITEEVYNESKAERV
jgi:hypothetical protein